MGMVFVLTWWSSYFKMTILIFLWILRIYRVLILYKQTVLPS